MTLRAKFTYSIAALILVIIAGISFSIYITQKNFLTDQLEQNRQRIFKDFAYTCTESLVVKDEIQVFNTIKSVIKTHDPAIVYAGYISPSGTILHSTRDTRMPTYFLRRMSGSNRASIDTFVSPADETIRELAIPILIQNEYRGTIKAGFSQSYMERQVRDSLYVIALRIALVAVIAFLVGIGLANLLAVYLNSPITALAAAADKIGAGDLEVQVAINRQDELGRLGMRFNEMSRKLKELDQLKDGFVSSVSHELRSPLAAIDGYCDYLLDAMGRNLPPEKQEKSLKIIKEATIRLTNFINNILDLAKIKAGKFELRRMPVNLHELVTEITSLFESLVNQQNKVLLVNLPDTIPSVDVDPEKIKQVFTNLIGNALKFTSDQAEITVTVRVPVTQEGEEPDYVEAWIADTGIGIPPEAVDKVFEKFYQVKESDMKKPKGTGLGLAIVEEIIKLHQGKIWVESRLGKGTVFKFTLPVWKAARSV